MGRRGSYRSRAGWRSQRGHNRSCRLGTAACRRKLGPKTALALASRRRRDAGTTHIIERLLNGDAEGLLLVVLGGLDDRRGAAASDSSSDELERGRHFTGAEKARRVDVSGVRLWFGSVVVGICGDGGGQSVPCGTGQRLSDRKSVV